MSGTIVVIAIITLADSAIFLSIDSAISIEIPVAIIVGAKFRFTARDQEITRASAHLRRKQLLSLLQFLLLSLQALNSDSLKEIEGARLCARIAVCFLHS